MSLDVNLAELVRKGGVYTNVKGSTPEDVYEWVLKQAQFPESMDKGNIYMELCEREKVLSTAVGQGVAIPHPRRPMVENEEDQRILLCFLEKPIDMGAPDKKDVYVMFIVLSSSIKTHLAVLGDLARAVKNVQFRAILEKYRDEKTVLSALDRL